MEDLIVILFLILQDAEYCFIAKLNKKLCICFTITHMIAQNIEIKETIFIRRDIDAEQCRKKEASKPHF